jgi:excisionase family DNA binding protein
MPEQELLTLAEAADILRLQSGETFSRFARRHGIPLLKIGSRLVRVRASDLEKFMAIHTHTPIAATPNTEGGRT